MNKGKKPKTKGRPSKYRPEYCDQLIGHMKHGLSFESFGAVIGVNRDTLYEWARVHQDFSDAKKRGTDETLLFWEKMGMAGMTGKIKGFNSTVWIFSMKNRFGWRDLPPEAPKMAQTSELDEALAYLDELEAKEKKQG